MPFVPHEERDDFRFFSEQDVPLELEEGDVLMELYEIGELIGRGGMGVVFQVYHREWGIDLALKCPRPVGRATSRWAELFERECETWIGLPPHPHAVQCYYFQRLGGVPRVFMELIHGTDLERCVSGGALYQGEPVEVMARILDVSIQFAHGLQHAHDHGVIHQDVKPSNLLVDPDWHVKITDFGLAKVWAEETSRPKSKKDALIPQRVGGTRAYCSPEHRSDADVNEQSDIWCLGVSILEMFSGAVYWRQGPLAGEALEQLVQRGPRRSNLPVIPAGMISLLRACFESQPGDRPDSMLSVSDEIRSIYESEVGVPYPRPRPAPIEMSNDLLNNRAVSLLELGNTAQADQIWSEIETSDTEQIEAFYNRRLHLWRTGLISNSEIVREIEQKHCEESRAWMKNYLVARTLIESGRCTDAVKLLEKIDSNRHTEGEVNRNVAFAMALAQTHTQQDVALKWRFHVAAPFVTAISFDADQTSIVSGDVNGRIRVWNLESGRSPRSAQAHNGRVFSIAGSPDGRIIATGGEDGLVQFWEASTLEHLGTATGHENAVRSVVFAGDRDWLYSSSRDATIRVWDTNTFKELGCMKGHKASVSTIAVSGDGRFLISGSRDRTMKIWNARQGKCMETTPPGYRPISGVHINHSGTRAYSSSGRKVKAWDLDSGIVLKTLRPHRTEIISLSINERVGFGISASNHSTRVWRLESGQCVFSLAGVAPAALSDDGIYAATGDARGELGLWTVNAAAVRLKAPMLICRHGDTSNSG